MQLWGVSEFRDEDAWSQFLELSVEGAADYSPGSPEERKAMFPAKSGATSTYDQGSPSKDGPGIPVEGVKLPVPVFQSFELHFTSCSL